MRIEGLVLVSDGDEAGNKIILTDFLFNLLDKGEIAVIDHHIIFVFNEEMVEGSDDIDNLISSWLV